MMLRLFQTAVGLIVTFGAFRFTRGVWLQKVRWDADPIMQRIDYSMVWFFMLMGGLLFLGGLYLTVSAWSKKL